MIGREKFIRIIPSLVVFMIVSYGFGYNLSIWKKSNESFNSEVKSIFISKNENVYVGTSKALFASGNGGKDFNFVFSPPGENITINDIYVPPDDELTIFVATDSGLYKKSGLNKNWSRIYYSSNKEEARCLAVKKVGNKLFLGTERGLLYCKNERSDFVKIKKDFDDKAIYKIKGDEDILIISSNNEVFIFDVESNESRRIFFEGKDYVLNDEDELDVENQRTIKTVSVNLGVNSIIFVATNNWIFYSYDSGNSWERINAEGIPLDKVNAIDGSTGNNLSHGGCNNEQLKCLDIIVSTKRGVFLYSKGKWIPVYKGMETNNVNCLAMGAKGNVFAGTDKGVFTLLVSGSLPSDVEIISNFKYIDVNDEFENEPKIKEVHQLAIDYGEVHPDKIRNWRKLAKKRACFPDVSLSFDVDRNRTIANSVYGSYSNGGQHYVGPDDKTFYRNTGVGVSLSWNLADIVWSSDQTSIDSRSKMMVELREDILDHVTRLYYERRRVQVELLTLSEIGPQLKLDQEMRLAELTALLDAFTGGEFSRRIDESKRHNDARKD